MSMRLIVTVIAVILLVTFIGFNLDNRCDISLAFYTLENVPVVLTILTAFALGLIVALPFSRHRGSKEAKTPKESKRDKKEQAVGPLPQGAGVPEDGAGHV